MRRLLFIGMMLGTPFLHANTCATSEDITTFSNPITGSVQDGKDNVNEYYYSLSPGTDAILILSDYTANDKTSVYLSTSCPPSQSDKILNGGTLIASESLLGSASDTFYITIEEATNKSAVSNYQFYLTLVTSTPTVTDNIFNIYENANNGAVVGVVNTTDGVPTSFTIVSGNGDGIFTIDNFGVIRVDDNSNLDYETTTSYSLDIRADNALGTGTSGTITINIDDIEEDPPIVSDDIFSISETASNTTPVGTVSTSGGTPALFTILSGNSDGIFTIDNTGIITILDNSNLDYNTTTSYSLEIQASNIAGSDTGTITINITQGSFDYDTYNTRDFIKVNADTNIFGDLLMIGNHSLCKKNGTTDCVDPGSDTNNAVYQEHINKDSIAAAAGHLNSTSADLVLGPNDVVVEAWLYWIGRIKDEDSKRPLARTVQLRVPGSDTYTAITSLASKFSWISSSRGWDYGGGANITSYVQAAGAGTYWIADLQATEMYNQGSGWTIAIIVRDTTNNTRTMKNISLYDGFIGVKNNEPGWPASVTSPISGFRTPNSGTIDANLIIFSGESDRNLDDSLSITNSAGGIVLLQDSLNDTSNVQNATISKNGANVTTRNPNYANTLGIDIDEIDTSHVMGHNQQSTNITVTSNGDRIFLAMYGFATELYIPQLCYDYAYKQYDRYFTEDNNGSYLPNIVGSGLTTSEPITVELFFKNTENSDILFSNITVDITDMNSTQATYAPNSTYVINPGEVFPQQYNTITGIPVNDIDSQDYFFLDYDLDLLTSSIDMPLNAEIHYEIVFSDGSGVTSTIPYTTDIYSMPLCSNLNFAYQPVYGTFNVEDTALAGTESDISGQIYNLPTQTANRPGDFRVVAYDPVNINTRIKVSTPIAIELIDAGKYHGIDAACNEPDSALTPRIWTSFGNIADGNTSMTEFNAALIQKAIDNNYLSYDIVGGEAINSVGDYYQHVRENVAFRISYNTPGDGDLIKLNPDPCQGGQIENCYTVENFPDFSAIDLGYGAGNCAQDIDNNPTNVDKIPQVCGNSGTKGMDSVTLAVCMECIYGYNINYLCSRDNFAIRPESFRTQLKDQDQSDVTQQSPVALNDVNVSHDNSHLSNTGNQVVAGYQYALEINATNHEDDTPTPGYDASFLVDGDNGTRTFQLKWHDITNNALCNDTEDQNRSVTLFNGHAELNISSDQVGKYDLNLYDKLWTRVDWDPTAMAHHTTGPYTSYFLSGTDCVQNTSYVPVTGSVTGDDGSNLTNVSGCDITSANHVNSNTGTEYYDLPLRVHPYEFDLSTLDQTAGPSNKYFVYINTPDADDKNMTYNMNGIFRAVGRDGGHLSNFVYQCYADDVNMTLYLQYQHANPTDSEPFLSYDLIDINTTDPSQAHIRPRPTPVPGEPTYRFITTGPLSITQDDDYFAKDLNGSINMDLGYNFKRNFNETMNPRLIRMDDFNITYVSNPVSIKADMESDFQIFGNKTLDRNVTFLYGKAKPAKFFYEDIIDPSVITPVSLVAYCDLGFTTCQDRGIMAAFAGTNESDWWFSIDHRTSDNDGDVVLAVGAITEGGPGAPAVASTAINIDDSSATDDIITVTSGATETELPMTVEIDFNTNAALTTFTDDWLIYNEYDNDVPSPFYKVRFIGDSNWTGIGDEGMVVGTEASKRKTKRLDW